MFEALNEIILKDCLKYIKLSFEEFDKTSCSPMELEIKCEKLKDILAELF